MMAQSHSSSLFLYCFFLPGRLTSHTFRYLDDGLFLIVNRTDEILFGGEVNKKHTMWSEAEYLNLT